MALELIADLDAGRLASSRAAVAGKAQPLSHDELRDVPGTDQPLGCRRLVRPPRAVPGDLRPAALPAAGMPERGRACRRRSVTPAAQTFGLAPARRAVCPRAGRIRSSMPGKSAALWGRRLLQSRIVFLAGERRAAPAGRTDVDGVPRRDRPDVSDRAETSGERDRADEDDSTAIRRRPRVPRRLRAALDPIATAWRRARRSGDWSGSASASSRATRTCGRIYGKSWADDDLRSDRRRPQGGGTRRERLDAGRRRRGRAGRDARRANGRG